MVSLAKREYGPRSVGMKEYEKWESFKKKLLQVLKGYSIRAKRVRKYSVKAATERVLRYEHYMDQLPPSAERIRKCSELKRLVAEAQEEVGNPSMQNAWEKLSRQERCTANFAKQYKASFEAQFVTELYKTPDWKQPETKDPVKVTKTEEVLNEATIY